MGKLRGPAMMKTLVPLFNKILCRFYSQLAPITISKINTTIINTKLLPKEQEDIPSTSSACCDIVFYSWKKEWARRNSFKA